MPQPVYYPSLVTTFVADAEGFLVDPFSLEVEVLTDGGDEALARAAVDVATDYPAGDRLSVGYFRAPYDPQSETWGPGLDPGPGRRIVRWYAELESGDAVVSWTTYTERLTAGAKPDGLPYYATIADLRDEGFATGVLSDTRAAMLLQRATAYIESFTGRRFVPEPKDLALEGRGGPKLMLGEPIVALDPDGLRVDLEPYPTTSSSLLPYSRDSIRVYNRHLSQRLTNPDDRQNPKVEVYDPVGIRDFDSRGGGLLSRVAFPRGQQNVHLRGVFGFTEYDGSPMGRTPLLVKHAAMLLVRRHMTGGGIGAGGGPSGSSAVTSERTRDQSVSYASPTSVGSGRAGSVLLGAFTGDPEIDTILASFMRPPSIAAV